jgi:hypothetical protein
MLKQFLVIIDHSVTEPFFMVTISKSDNPRALPGRKFYTEQTLLEKDLRQSLKPEDGIAAAEALGNLKARSTWAKEMRLTEEDAARLGWVR